MSCRSLLLAAVHLSAVSAFGPPPEVDRDKPLYYTFGDTSNDFSSGDVSANVCDEGCNFFVKYLFVMKGTAADYDQAKLDALKTHLASYRVDTTNNRVRKGVMGWSVTEQQPCKHQKGSIVCTQQQIDESQIEIYVSPASKGDTRTLARKSWGGNSKVAPQTGACVSDVTPYTGDINVPSSFTLAPAPCSGPMISVVFKSPTYYRDVISHDPPVAAWDVKLRFSGPMSQKGAPQFFKSLPWFASNIVWAASDVIYGLEWSDLPYHVFSYNFGYIKGEYEAGASTYGVATATEVAFHRELVSHLATSAGNGVRPNQVELVDVGGLPGVGMVFADTTSDFDRERGVRRSSKIKGYSRLSFIIRCATEAQQLAVYKKLEPHFAGATKDKLQALFATKPGIPMEFVDRSIDGFSRSAESTYAVLKMGIDKVDLAMMPPTVKVEFTLNGDVADFDGAAQASIAATIAKGADVPTSAVRVTLASGSVTVTAEIFVDDQATADAKASALAAGILKDAVSLEAALKAQLTLDGVSTANLKVEGTIAAPTSAQDPRADTSGIPPGEQGGSSSTVIIAAAAGGGGGAVVFLGIILCWCRRRKRKARGKAATASPVTAAPVSAA